MWSACALSSPHSPLSLTQESTLHVYMCSHYYYRYDSKRVPAFPLSQGNRELFLKTKDLDLTGYPSHQLQKKAHAANAIKPSDNVVVHLKMSQDIDAMAVDKEVSFAHFEDEVDTVRARLQSHQYITSLTVVSSKSVKVTQLPSDEAQCVLRTVSRTSGGSSHSSSGSSAVSSVTTTVVCQEEESTVSLRVDVSYHSVVTAEPWYHPWAQVGKVGLPSTIRPVAPDGMCVCHVFWLIFDMPIEIST